ncbi:hemagglutinin repeat-containing protein, partial [Biostraticola tofi]
MIGLNLSYGAQSSTSEQTQTRHQSQGSQLTAGNNLKIEATQADITVQGSQLQAGNDLGLTALTDVKLLSASDTSVLDGTNSSLGGSLGIGFNIGQGKLGLTL